ncbi:hypothetical protein BCR35DRAFT_121147 [Leucosporidium creatinivorum]|uniref:DUF202 domain-containing protein n=1 Tax=Leucosporidium creatinivorum TaxID=106004 RepID=A0A1Y2EY70_9BASI|nr:hypothetical protein BCR35DRAFT_121147 [Leucosporidium creatinivorum]
MAHFPPPTEVISHLFPPAKPEVPHRYKGHRRNSWTTQDIDELVELRARQRTFDGAYVRTALGNFGYALLILKVFNKEFARIGLLYVILAVLLLLISYRRSRRSDHDFSGELGGFLTLGGRVRRGEAREVIAEHGGELAGSGQPRTREVEDGKEDFKTELPLMLIPSPDRHLPPSRRSADPPNPLRSPIFSLPPPLALLTDPLPFSFPSITITNPSPTHPPPAANQRNWGRAFKTSGDVVVLVGIVCTALYAAIFALVMRL